MKVIAIGDNCIDYYKHLDKIYSGGNAVNFSVYMRRLGIHSSYVGAIGNDDNGKFLLKSLSDEFVDVSRIKIIKGTTAITTVEFKGTDRILDEYDEGVMANFSIDEEIISFANAHDLIHTSIWGNIHKDLNRFNVPAISFDFSTKLESSIVKESIPYVDYGFFSYQEKDSYIKDYLESMVNGGLKVATATLGKNGSISYDGKNFYYEESIPCSVIDTLGAGDSFISAYMVGILNGKTIKEALKLGSIYASKIIEHHGAW